MRCSHCQHENRPEARFCLSCGAELGAPCPACGTELPPGARFCDGCGAELTEASKRPAASPRDPRSYTPKHLADRILTSKSAIEGERKHVTVLFADLAESTPLSQELDPEEMHRTMDRCFQLMLEEVHRFEGTVNQFTGDGIMALFGAPIALEDAPRRAVMAALAIQRVLAPLHEEMAARTRIACGMRIGIHSGTVVVGRIGDDLRMDYTAVGDTTNLADRLQRLAPTGGVVVSESTRRLVSGYFDVEPLPPAKLKGFTEPVESFRVLRERQAGDRLEAAAATGLTPYVGRQRDIETLLAAFESAESGRGRVVFLVGEAGMGKSRLRYEFRHRLEGRDHAWTEGRCASYARNSAFFAIADTLRRAFGIDGRDDDATALAKLEEAERASGGELEWTLPFVRQLLSLPVGDTRVEEMEAATRRSETYRALHARLLRVAETKPVVLVVEDLHWIDEASAEFLSFVADSVPATRILLLVTFRPDYRHRFGDRSYYDRITLQSLSGDEMETMTTALLESLAAPESLRRLIAAKAEGNPFFVEEVAHSLIEEFERDHARLAGGAASFSVPDSIQDVLMARIDRLAETPKHAIQVASVIGREFALQLLDRISEVGSQLPTVVDELRVLEFIYEKTAHPELAFMFKHALTREVAYESILQQRRQELHGLVGSAIEELYADRLPEHYETLAHHFSLAEDWERALDYHEKAAEKSIGAYANHAAAEHARRALEIADRLGAAVSDERRSRLAGRMAWASWLSSDFGSAAEAYRRAAATGTPYDRGMNLCRASYAAQWGHDYALSRATAAEARVIADANDLDSLKGMTSLTRCFDRATTHGDLAGFEQGIEEGLRLAEGDDDVTTMALCFSGEVSEWKGDYPKAVAQLEKALEISRRLRRPDYTIYAIWFLGKASCCLGRYGEALDQLDEALQMADHVGDRAWKTRLLNTIGWCHAEIGGHDRALAYNQQSAVLANEMLELDLVPGADELHGNAAINLAGNRIALGTPEAAADQIAPIREAIGKEGDPWMRWRYAMHLDDVEARLHLAFGRPESALELAGREVESARRHLSQKCEARALALRGCALLATEQHDEVEEQLRSALAVGERIGYPPVIWRSHALLAELARRTGRRTEAGIHEARVRALVEELATPLASADLKRDFRALCQRLLEDPLGACASSA